MTEKFIMIRKVKGEFCPCIVCGNQKFTLQGFNSLELAIDNAKKLSVCLNIKFEGEEKCLENL